MPTHFSCPHCQSLLQVPENSGGAQTKCPSCADDFVIPGPATQSQATPVCAVLAPIEGKVTQSDLDRARAQREQLTTENVGLQVELARRGRHARRLATRLAWLERFAAGRRWLDHTVGRGGGFFLAITLGPALWMVAASVFPLSAFGFFFVAVLGFIAAASAYIPFSYFPDDPKLAVLISRLGERVVDAEQVRDQLTAEEAKKRERLEAAESEYQRVRAALDSRLHWLRTCQWQQMTGKNFVNFLKLVFEEHGYTVEPTGKMGQVGIDLVVVRDEQRTAVAARAAVKGPVDRPVVQQTHAGRTRYQCPAAVVVSAAEFTPSARAAGESLPCQLIDGSQIPDLIEGRIRV